MVAALGTVASTTRRSAGAGDVGASWQQAICSASIGLANTQEHAAKASPQPAWAGGDGSSLLGSPCVFRLSRNALRQRVRFQLRIHREGEHCQCSIYAGSNPGGDRDNVHDKLLQIQQTTLPRRKPKSRTERTMAAMHGHADPPRKKTWRKQLLEPKWLRRSVQYSSTTPGHSGELKIKSAC